MLLRVITGFGMAVLTAMPAAAEKLSLGEISAFFNAMGTARGDFTQINDDGSTSQGQIMIKRPGKMRFEYTSPQSTRVIVGSNTVLIEDAKSNTPPDSYPLSRTPLALILARNVDLARADMVVGHAFDGTATRVTAQDPENPEYGSIELFFTAGPVALRQWVIDDGSGSRTTMILGPLERDMSLPNRLFDVGRDDGGRE